MRDAFVRALEAAAERDSRVVFLTGDLGFRIFDRFMSRFPGRYVNVGVAEAQLICAAAGLAMTGLRPVAYSIAPFLTARPLEFIRNTICYHKIPVVLVGVGGGYAYGPNGPTHHGVDDLALMRAMPGMTVVAPGDPWEVTQALPASLAVCAPVYLRLGRAGESILAGCLPNDFVIGRARRLRNGNDATLLVTGAIAATALKVADSLSDRGVSLRVVQMHTLKPLDTDELGCAIRETRLIVTLEEHAPIGGLGSAVSDWSARVRNTTPVLCISGPDELAHESGSQDYFCKKHRLDSGSVADIICDTLSKTLG